MSRRLQAFCSCGLPSSELMCVHALCALLRPLLGQAPNPESGLTVVFRARCGLTSSRAYVLSGGCSALARVVLRCSVLQSVLWGVPPSNPRFLSDGRFLCALRAHVLACLCAKWRVLRWGYRSFLRGVVPAACRPVGRQRSRLTRARLRAVARGRFSGCRSSFSTHAQ